MNEKEDGVNKTIETSICITEDRKMRLISAARKLDVPVRVVLAALMRKTRIAFNEDRALLWKAVRYQKRAKPNFYQIWHVSLEPRCYEFGVSERLVFKVSVSLIYGVAIDLFLEGLVNQGLDSKVCEDDIATSYLQARYDVIYLSVQNDEFWIIKWDRRLKKRE